MLEGDSGESIICQYIYIYIYIYIYTLITTLRKLNTYKQDTARDTSNVQILVRFLFDLRKLVEDVCAALTYTGWTLKRQF
jgi:hypothetical protein